MSQAPYIFPIIGGRKIENLKSNIAALQVDLTEEEMKEIESAAPVSLGYPHVILAGRDDQHVGPTNPTFIAMWSSGFEGVEEPKVRTHQFSMLPRDLHTHAEPFHRLSAPSNEQAL